MNFKLFNNINIIKKWCVMIILTKYSLEFWYILLMYVTYPYTIHCYRFNWVVMADCLITM